MIKFSHARTALKYGLISLNLKNEDEIILPAYNCDAVLMPIHELNIKYRFYEIDNSLSPDWQSIEKVYNKNSRALLVVNYFGQPQDYDRIIKFCKKNNLFLIEDNAHGHGGTLDNIPLGTIGDIGLSSPKKIINIYSGGVLYSKHPLNVETNSIDSYPISNTSYHLRKILNKNPKLKEILKKIVYFRRPKHEDPFYYKTPKIKDYKIDYYSNKKISETNWNEIRKIKQNNYYLWQEFCLKNKLRPVFKNLNKGSVPWCFPAYAQNTEDSIKWFKCYANSFIDHQYLCT